MTLKIVKKGFNYSQDGPGNRLVFHLFGCNMRCVWCANPETLFGDGFKEYGIDSLVEECTNAAPLFFDGGGVTLTGGEPTLQFDEAKEFLTKLKTRGINTAIETNGAHERLEELFPLTDTLITDFKHYDPEAHKRFTGMSNEVIKSNIAKAFSFHPDLLIRTPLINGVNSSDKDIQGFLDFYTMFDVKNARFEMLEYHEYGKVKWEKAGKEYKMKDGKISIETLKKFEDEYKKRGLKVVRT